MCDECHSSPHLPGRPNEPEPPITCFCDSCHVAKFAGDDYYEVSGFPHCADCVTQKTAEIEEEDEE